MNDINNVHDSNQSSCLHVVNSDCFSLPKSPVDVVIIFRVSSALKSPIAVQGSIFLFLKKKGKIVFWIMFRLCAMFSCSNTSSPLMEHKDPWMFRSKNNIVAHEQPVSSDSDDCQYFSSSLTSNSVDGRTLPSYCARHSAGVTHELLLARKIPNQRYDFADIPHHWAHRVWNWPRREIWWAQNLIFIIYTNIRIDL